MRTAGKRRLLCLVLAVLVALPTFVSCRMFGRNEPEQVYLIASMGFDADGDRLRLTAEVPLTRENEAEEMETRLFRGQGTTVEEALESTVAGLAKGLLFSHCALIVLGDGLTWEQIRMILDYVSAGASVPLAAQVISAPVASELLEAGSLSTPAAGYDIPGIIKQRSQNVGLDIRCRLYEIGAVGADGGMVLPRFMTADPESGTNVSLGGTRVCLPSGDFEDLSVAESVSFALLTGTFIGGDGKPGSPAETELRHVRDRVEMTEDGEMIRLTLSVRMDAPGNHDSRKTDALAQRLAEEAQAFYTERTDLDPIFQSFFLEKIPERERERLKEMSGIRPELNVRCEIYGKEAGGL